MPKKATAADAEIILKLYEFRRERDRLASKARARSLRGIGLQALRRTAEDAAGSTSRRSPRCPPGREATHTSCTSCHRSRVVQRVPDLGMGLLSVG